MKKVLLSLSMMVLTGTMAFAQYYHFCLPNTGNNPNNINQEDMEYPLGGGLPTTWFTILSSAQPLGTLSSWQSIPFNFDFNGSAVDSFRVTNTGILTFSQKLSPTSHSAANLVPINHSSVPDSSICVLGINGSGASDNVVSKLFGTAPNRQQWITFSSFSATGTAASHWTYWSIVLEETTNNIYIVDQKTANATPIVNIGIRVNSSNYDQILQVAAQADNDPTPANNTYYTFAQGNQPDYDIEGVELNVDRYLVLGSSPYLISADFLNNGSQNITSCTFSYSIDNLTPVTSNISNTNLPSCGLATIASSTSWTPSTSGSYVIKVWLDGLNGSNVDSYPFNDTVTKLVQVINAPTARYPLYETFTSSTCPPCVLGNTTLENLFSGNPGKSN
ncbi:MAG: hypothetical protein CMP53_04800, partial [Flavobacteriales bacterium]|nr:hypothetical protein [Flavobacteriales bacterium]